MNYGKRGTRKQIKAVNSTAKKLKTKALINILKAVLVIVLLISVTGVYNTTCSQPLRRSLLQHFWKRNL